MMDITELYQELILDHSRHPRHFGKMHDPTHHAHGINPICGDDCEVFLNLHDQTIKDIQFHGIGCAISLASASLMSELIESMDIPQAIKYFEQFHQMIVTGEVPRDQLFDKLKVLSQVKQFPMRVKCATLPWHTLIAALENKKVNVTTELGNE